MNPAFWPGSGGAGGGGGKPGVGTGTVMVTTLSLASSRSLDSFSICREDRNVTKRIYLVNLPILLATISTPLHHFDVYINSKLVIIKSAHVDNRLLYIPLLNIPSHCAISN